MKILLLSDIHANWPALVAIRESFDVCLFMGDLVDYGTNPVPCIEWIRTHATAAIRGNHDHAVAQRVPARNGGGFKSLTAATRPINWKLLDSARMKFLARLPVTRHVVINDVRFFLVHGTPRDPLDEYLEADGDAWNVRLQDVDADYVCVGHTHSPFRLDLGRLQVINPGSVGQPRDGDARCSYAVIENGAVEIRRVEYDIDATLAQMKETGIDADALDLAESVLRSGGSATKRD